MYRSGTATSCSWRRGTPPPTRRRGSTTRGSDRSVRRWGRILDGHLPYPAVIVDRLLTTLTHFGTAVDVTIAELRLEAFLPADEATAAILTQLVRGRMTAVRWRSRGEADG